MEKKYLLFSMFRRNTGADNVFAMLGRIFREARYLGRIPVIGKFTIGPAHNLGRVKTDFCFEDYVDLSNGITRRLEGGWHKPIAFHLDWMKEENLNLGSYFFDKVHFLSDDEIVTEEMNRHYDVLIRRDPTFQYARTHTHYIKDNISIDFPYSDNVNKLTDEVLDVFGISRKQATTIQRYFFNKFSDVGNLGGVFGLSQGSIPTGTGCYACMHVRASINDRDYGQPIFTFGSYKEQISAAVKQAISKGSKLYIMSDIHQNDFFNFLKPDYQIYRYHDFPQLRRLVSDDEDTVDNVMLYLVEKNIMRHATVKILPPHKGPMLYHLNTVYDLSFLKNPPVKRPRPTKTKIFIGDCLRKLGFMRILGRRL